MINDNKHIRVAQYLFFTWVLADATYRTVIGVGTITTYVLIGVTIFALFLRFQMDKDR